MLKGKPNDVISRVNPSRGSKVEVLYLKYIEHLIEQIKTLTDSPCVVNQGQRKQPYFDFYKRSARKFGLVC